MPRRGRKPIRLWQGAAEQARGISVYLMPDGTLRILYGRAIDVETPPGFLAPGQDMVLRILACREGRRDLVDVLNADTGQRFRTRPGRAVAPRLEDALPADQGFAEIAHVVAIATHCIAATDLPGLATGTMVETPDGQVRVETLRRGMRVLGHDGRPHVIRWIDARDRLCLGRTAPVLLRAPYFGLGEDTCVTPETRLLRDGADVEYLAGTERVLIRAADLVAGAAAQIDRRRPVRRFHHLLLDDPACLRVWRCRMETAFLSEVLSAEDGGSALARPDDKDCGPSLPLLDRAAARALLSRGAGAQHFVL